MRALIASAGLAVCLWVLTAGAAAQSHPECDPATAAPVTLTAEDDEGGDGARPVATHPITVSADVSGNVTRVRVAAPAGVREVASSGSSTRLIAPDAASVDITVSWRQPRDPSDPGADPDDPATGCTASRVIPVALLAAQPTRALKHELWRQLGRLGVTDVGIVPARRQANLSPLEISARTTSRVAFPPSSAKPRTMSVPLRKADEVKYPRRLPGLAGITVPQACRFYYLACATPFAPGGAFVEVGSLDEPRNVNGSLTRLARAQPFRTAAPGGLLVEARPGGVRPGRPRSFGYDVQVRQSGRLIARVRRAGRCVEARASHGGLVTRCRIARFSAQLR